MRKTRYLWLLLPFSLLYPQEPTILIFDNLDAWIEKSPEYQALLSKRDGTRARRAKALAWPSPTLSYAAESAGSQTESAYLLNQSIPLPWYKAPLRKSWNHRMAAADLRQGAMTYALHSRLRLSYISLALSREAKSITERLQASGQQLQKASRARREEGGQSKVDEALILWTHSQLQASAQQRAASARQIESEFLQLLGLSPTKILSLESWIQFAALDYSDPSKAVQLWKAGSINQAWDLEISAGQKALQAAKAGAFSEIILQGGTKTVAGEGNGLALGLSIPLPLLGQSRANRKLRLSELELAKIGHDSYRRQSESRIREIHRTITDVQALLVQVPSQTDDDRSLAALQSAYREGLLSLTDYLNALQIRAGAVDAYYRLLNHYYGAIIELEDLTETRFLTFSAVREDN